MDDRVSQIQQRMNDTRRAAALSAETLVGLSEAEATARVHTQGYSLRLGRRDDDLFRKSADGRPNRISVAIDNGRVASVSVG
jgi:hypothetical protein